MSTAVESRARRAAARAGYILKKSRWRQGTHDNLGDFKLIDPFLNAIVAGEHYDLSAEEALELIGADGEAA